MPYLCQVQGVTVQYFLITAMLWTASLSTNILTLFIFRRTPKELLALEKYYHAFNWIVPFAISVGIIFCSQPGLGTVYGDATFWCWITGNYQALRMYAFYGPLWAIFGFNALTYVWVGKIIWSADRK